MSFTYSEYLAAMIGCYAALSDKERKQLHAWERENVDGSGYYATSDWPGWEKYIGKYRNSQESESMSAFGYVYLIHSAGGSFKIGASQSVHNRLKQLQSANPDLLTLVHYFPSKNAQDEERLLHVKFAKKRIRNEWFDLDESDVEGICAMHGNGGSKDQQA